MAYDFLPDSHEQRLSAEIEQHLGENRGRAVGTLNVYGTGTLNRSHYVDPDFYQLAFNRQLTELANLNDASISIPQQGVQEKARQVYAKEQTGKLADAEKNNISDRARANAADLIHLQDSKRIVFGRNTTEAIGLTYYLADVKDGDMVVSDAENSSVYKALQYNRDNGNPYRTDRLSSFPTWYSTKGPDYPPMEEHKRSNNIARFALESYGSNRGIRNALESAITADTKLLLFSHVVRSTGNEVPAKEMCRFAREIKHEKNPEDPDIFIVIDGTQAVGNLSSVNVDDYDADAYAYSTYKTLGSPPIGILAVTSKNPRIKDQLEKLGTLSPENEHIILDGMFDRQLGVQSNVNDSLSYADLEAFNETMRNLPFPQDHLGDFSQLAEHRLELRTYFGKKLRSLNAELGRKGMYLDHHPTQYGGDPGDVEIITEGIREWISVSNQNAVVAEVDVDKPTSFILSFFFRGALTWGREDQIWQELAERGAFCSCIAFDRFSDQPSVFRVSFGASTTTADVDNFVSSLRSVLFKSHELNKEERDQGERDRLLAKLTEEERDWRIYPDDGGDPREISDTCRGRNSNAFQKRESILGDLYDYRKGILDYRNYWGKAEAKKAAYELAKYFPVLWISAPHVESKVNATFPGEPTPLLYATALLDRHLRIGEFPSSIREPNVTSVMNPPVYNAQFERALIEHLQEHRPRVVGISNISEGHHYAIEIARLIKKHSPDSVVIFGGSHEDDTHPSGYRRAAEKAAQGTIRGGKANSETFALSEDELRKMDGRRTLAKPDERELIDFVTHGDAPYIVMELMKIIADNPGATPQELKEKVLACKDNIAKLPGSGFLAFYNSEEDQIEDLPISGTPLDRDKLPPVDRRRLSHENRFPVFDYKKTAQVMTEVGCKYACEFCQESADAILQGTPNIQLRSSENVIKELKILRQQGYEAIFFDDSTFTQSSAKTNEILDLMIREKIDFEWGCQTTIEDVDDALLTKMAQAGCTYIYFGFEQASATEQGVQKAQKKKFVSLPIIGDAQKESWNEQFKHVASLCKKHSIRIGTSLQFGLGESEEDRRRTIDVIEELAGDGMIPDRSVALNVNALYPGTVQWIKAMKTDRELPDYSERLQRDPRFETAHQFGSLTTEEIEKLYQYAEEKLGDALVRG